MAGAAAASRRWSPRPARLGRRREQQPAGRGAWEGQQDARSEALGRSCFSTPGSPCPPCSRGRTPGSLTVSQKRQQRGQEQQGCWAHGAACSRAPGRGRGRGTGDSERRGHGWGAESVLGRAAGPPPPPAPDRISTTASAWRRRRGSPRGAEGGGAGGAAYRKVSSKGAKTQKQEHRLLSHASPGERTALLMWHTAPAFPSCPRPAKLATLNWVSSFPRYLVLIGFSINENNPLPTFLHPTLVPEGSKNDLGRSTLVRQLVRPACSCGSSILGR